MLSAGKYNPADRDLLHAVSQRLSAAGMLPAAMRSPLAEVAAIWGLHPPSLRPGWILGVTESAIHVYHGCPQLVTTAERMAELDRYRLVLVEHFAVTLVESTMPHLPPFLLVRPL